MNDINDINDIFYHYRLLLSVMTTTGNYIIKFRSRAKRRLCLHFSIRNKYKQDKTSNMYSVPVEKMEKMEYL